VQVRAAIYARVSTEAQEARGTVGSQLDALRERVAAVGDDLVATFCDEGHSGARLDRPGLDALRDGAEAGMFEVVWCLSPDRLARAYAYQVVVIDELARHGVTVRFADAPAINDDPQARLLTQVQGVIAEYERAKITERNRRGKLWRARAGEVITWKAPFGYRRVPRSGDTPAHLVVFEPEAVVVRRIFDDYVAGGHSIREITRRLNADGIASPSGRPVWSVSAIGNLLRNETYIGRLYFNRTKPVLDSRPGRTPRQVPRPKEEWIAIPVPAIVTDGAFEAAARMRPGNAIFSARRTKPETYLLRGLVRCGVCGVGTACHRRPSSRSADGWSRYYYCRNHDPLRAGGEERRCPERHIRADALDEFVFDQVRAALSRPEVLLAGQGAVATRAPAPDDELLDAQLARLDRKAEAVEAERRRLIDLYQAGLIELLELQRRAKEIDARRRAIDDQRGALAHQRSELAKDNRLRQRIGAFADRVLAAFDSLDFEKRQHLLRLVVEDVRVTGWSVDVRMRIPLDDEPDNAGADTASSNDRLRPLGSRRA
jgi:site-specific DNA recombinase